MLFVQSGLRLSLVIKFNVPGFRGPNEVNNSDVMAITINKVKEKVKELMKFWHSKNLKIRDYGTCSKLGTPLLN